MVEDPIWGHPSTGIKNNIQGPNEQTCEKQGHCYQREKAQGGELLALGHPITTAKQRDSLFVQKR